MIKVGDVIVKKGVPNAVKEVVVAIVDHNRGDYGACSRNETYYTVHYDILQKLILEKGMCTDDPTVKDDTFFVFKEDLESKWYGYTNRSNRPLEEVFEKVTSEDFKPFEVGAPKMISLRMMKPKKKQIIDWE